MYSPIIMYQDKSGITYKFDADYSSNSKEHSSNVTIYYDRNHPSQAIRAGFWHLWFFPFIILCLSMIPLGIGIYILRYYFNLYYRK